MIEWLQSSPPPPGVDAGQPAWQIAQGAPVTSVCTELQQHAHNRALRVEQQAFVLHGGGPTHCPIATDAPRVATATDRHLTNSFPRIVYPFNEVARNTIDKIPPFSYDFKVNRQYSQQFCFRASRHRNVGFSLIEVLVCIGVIALLIAIAVPSLRAARIGAVSKECLLNVRACTTATAQYAGDFKEAFPFQAERETFINAIVFNGIGLEFSMQTVTWPAVLRAYLDQAPVPKPSLCPATYRFWRNSGAQASGEPLAGYNLSYGLFSRPELWDSATGGADERYLKAIRQGDVLYPDRKCMFVEPFAFHLRGAVEPDVNRDNLLMLERPPGSLRARPISFCDGSARELSREPLRDPYAGLVGAGFWYHFAGIMTERGAQGLDLR